MDHTIPCEEESPPLRLELQRVQSKDQKVLEYNYHKKIKSFNPLLQDKGTLGKGSYS